MVAVLEMVLLEELEIEVMELINQQEHLFLHKEIMVEHQPPALGRALVVVVVRVLLELLEVVMELQLVK